MNTNNEENKFYDAILPSIADLTDKICCRQRVGRDRSLSLGFGKKIPHGKKRLIDDFYGEWELGTYSAAWRVIKNEQVICTSQDVVDSIADLDTALSRIQFEKFKSIEIISKFDIRLCFSNQIYLEFLGVINDDDEIFHIFGPEFLYIDYSIIKGWSIGKSNVPDSSLKWKSNKLSSV